MTNATIRDVARKAEVSVATVSRVLNKSALVSAPTREKVLGVIKALNYAPNPMARGLSSGRTQTIAVIVPLFTLPSFVERLRGVQHGLASTDYDLVLYSVETIEHRDHHFDKLARRGRADGLLIISIPPNDYAARRFLDIQIPTVLVDTSHPDLYSVHIDDVAGGFLAVKHLIELGHTKIAYLSDFLDDPLEFGPMKDRLTGYKNALKEAGIPLRDEYLLEGPRGRKEARQLARQLLTHPDPPTAIFAASDTQAIGVLDAARGLSLSVPKDLSVIGYDDIRDAEYVNLTTIRQPLFDTGKVGAQMLLDWLAKPNAFKDPKDKTMPVELVVRATTAQPLVS